MNKISGKILLILLAALTVTLLSTAVYAADPITVDSVIFSKYIDEYGMEDESLVSVTVSFTALSTSQISILLTSENISELTAETKPMVIYMDQTLNPADGIYEFAIEKSRIASATMLEDPDGCTLYIKMGGINVADMASDTVTYTDPYVSEVTKGDIDGDMEVSNRDATYLLRYLAGWELPNANEAAMDVNGDGEITNRDATHLLRYLAGWDVELK